MKKLIKIKAIILLTGSVLLSGCVIDETYSGDYYSSGPGDYGHYVPADYSRHHHSHSHSRHHHSDNNHFFPGTPPSNNNSIPGTPPSKLRPADGIGYQVD
jgi:hypothetical protein